MKLIRWGFTIQGGVDGFTRVVVYGKCSLNNRADTTLQLFKEAEINMENLQEYDQITTMRIDQLLCTW